MKIECLFWLEKIEAFVSTNTDWTTNFTPFVTEQEAIQFRDLLCEVDQKDMMPLCVAASFNQSVLQLIWVCSPFVPRTTALRFGNQSPEYAACCEMEQSNPIIDKYEDYYKDLLEAGSNEN